MNSIFDFPKKTKKNQNETTSNNNIKMIPFITKRDRKALIINDNYIMYFQRLLNTGEKRYICKEYNTDYKCKHMLTLNNSNEITEIINKHNHSGNNEECNFQ